jgi:hypothetical protein
MSSTEPTPSLSTSSARMSMSQVAYQIDDQSFVLLLDTRPSAVSVEMVVVAVAVVVVAVVDY